VAVVRWGRVDGVRGVTKQVLQQIFAAVLYTRALTKKQAWNSRKSIFSLSPLPFFAGVPHEPPDSRCVQTSATPGKFTALEDFFAQRRLRAAAKLLASPDLPDPVAHLVCKFWLGRPPRRGSGFY